MAFDLPNLPYDYNALEPYIDAKTMEFHHSKHHRSYVDNLNKALEKYPDFYKKPIEEILADIESIPSDVRQAVINHGGGHVNHTFFWKIMTPKPTTLTRKLLESVNSTFGNIDKFKEEFTSKAMSVSGSGWAFLIMTPDKKLTIKRHSFQNSPLIHGNIPILGIDVWEHAYYLKYQNRRADYISAWWNVVNWGQASEIFSKASH